jgi:hypothetical protein
LKIQKIRIQKILKKQNPENLENPNKLESKKIENQRKIESRKNRKF